MRSPRLRQLMKTPCLSKKFRRISIPIQCGTRVPEDSPGVQQTNEADSMIAHQTMVTDQGTLTRLAIADNEWMTTDDLRRIARQLNERAIAGERLSGLVPRHALTPSCLEYPGFDESCDLEPWNDRGVYRHAEEKG